MVEIGQLLRQTREAKELSLADVEEQTRIRQRYLSALESGDWDDLPNPVAARGFLRTYAAFLGLDDKELIDRSQEMSETGAPVPTAETQPSDYKPINLDLYDDVTRRSHLLRRVLGFILILIPVIILAWLLMQYGLPYLQGRAQGGESITATVELPPEGQAPGAAPVIAPTATPTGPVVTIEGALPTFTPTPDATDTPTITPSPTLTATPAEAIRLRVAVTQTAWIRVVTDGEVQIESLADPGYDQEFTAYQQLDFLTGNAGGVELTLDGKPLPPLGGVGEIAIFVWTLEDGQVIEITPTPSPTASPTPQQTGTPQATATPGG